MSTDDPDDKIKERRIRKWEREREVPETDACSLCGHSGPHPTLKVDAAGFPVCIDEMACWMRMNKR